jgi:hypothetical protein
MGAASVAGRLTVGDNAAAYGTQNFCVFAIRDNAPDADFRYLRDGRSAGS